MQEEPVVFPEPSAGPVPAANPAKLTPLAAGQIPAASPAPAGCRPSGSSEIVTCSSVVGKVGSSCGGWHLLVRDADLRRTGTGLRRRK
jgi:hypothetical protein